MAAFLLLGTAGAAWVEAEDGSNLLDRPLPAEFREAGNPIHAVVRVPRFFADQEEDDRGEAPGALRRFDRTRTHEREGSVLLGAQSGYLRARGAERGSAYGGIHGRIRLSDHFSGEGSIGVLLSEFARGDLHVIQVPVQGTLYYYPIAEGPVRPYLLAGLGFYYTKTEFRGNLDHVPNRPENIFGQHIGAGSEIRLGSGVTLDVSLKYVFQNPTIFSLERNALDYWQITVGFSCSF